MTTTTTAHRRNTQLSDTACRAAKPADKPYNLPDQRGLYLRVMPTGGKLWRWNYRYHDKQKTMTFGIYPDVPLALARERHDAARKLLAADHDPMAERKATKAARAAAAENSFERVARQWFDHWKPSKSPAHAGYVIRRLEADAFPLIGKLPVSEIPASAFRDVAKRIESRGALDVAKRVLETCGQVMRYSVAHDLAPRNTAADIKPADILPARSKTNYARVDTKELPALLRAIDRYNGRIRTRLAMQLMALTFVRTGELIGARWDEFDLDAARWTLPADRMKMRTPHIVPLSRQALAVLADVRQLTGDSPLLFCNDRDHRRPMSNNAILAALDAMGYKGRMTGHGFRGVASTLLHEQGWPHEHIELQLAHQPRNAVSAAYNHALYLPQRAAMMDAWGDFLDGQRADNVVQLARVA
ncbi:MAG: integrase arm-type DNA-binding domain-containing protein [Castellaniella sp.]|uniref:Tyrosine-type recombinase/integrase n=1 Tax=Castellaniella hirudinis TaxID=1144617 RepID=A0ABV8S0R1_9BURK